MPHEFRRSSLGPDHHLDDDTDMSEPAQAELVAETAAVFGEETARDLAGLLRVPFDIVLPEPQA